MTCRFERAPLDCRLRTHTTSKCVFISPIIISLTMHQTASKWYYFDKISLSIHLWWNTKDIFHIKFPEGLWPFSPSRKTLSGGVCISHYSQIYLIISLWKLYFGFIVLLVIFKTNNTVISNRSNQITSENFKHYLRIVPSIIDIYIFMVYRLFVKFRHEMSLNVYRVYVIINITNVIHPPYRSRIITLN